LLFGQNPVYHTLSGGLFLGAIFMATDYVTAPQTKLGRLIFGLLCAFLTVVIRVYSNYPEGVSFAILIMNILTPYINKLTTSKPLGAVGR
jgi:electron transport complex protein RnfD